MSWTRPRRPRARSGMPPLSASAPRPGPPICRRITAGCLIRLTRDSAWSSCFSATASLVITGFWRPIPPLKNTAACMPSQAARFARWRPRRRTTQGWKSLARSRPRGKPGVSSTPFPPAQECMMSTHSALMMPAGTVWRCFSTTSPRASAVRQALLSGGGLRGSLPAGHS